MSGLNDDLRKLHRRISEEADRIGEYPGVENQAEARALAGVERRLAEVLFRHGLAEGHARNPRRTTYDVNPDAPDPAAETKRAERGTPWCDTCSRPSVAMEGRGLLHSTDEHYFGVPRALDPLGHEVSHRQWFATPTYVDDAIGAAVQEL